MKTKCPVCNDKGYVIKQSKGQFWTDTCNQCSKDKEHTSFNPLDHEQTK